MHTNYVIIVILMICIVVYLILRDRKVVGNSLIKRPKIIATECSTQHYIDKDHDMYMYEVDNEVIGYCMYRQYENYTFIYWLCIASNHRGQGLGRAFLEDLFQVFIEEGSEYIELVSTPDQRGFYEELGFVQSDRRGSYRYQLR